MADDINPTLTGAVGEVETFGPTVEVAIQCEGDIVVVRRAVREAADRLGFGMTDTTRIVTGASELARNIFRYARPGVMRFRRVDRNGRRGLELEFEDHGPGIVDCEQSMVEGFARSGGLGLGLRGTKRIMDEMQIQTEIGKGTTVIVRKWQPS